MKRLCNLVQYIIAFTFLIYSNGVFAQTDTKLNRPVTLEGTAHDAAYTSLGGKLSVYIQLGTEDEISGEKYATVFANGFANREYMKGFPVYVTAVYSKERREGPTTVGFYSGGGIYNYEEQRVFLANTATKYLLIVVKDHIKEFGSGIVIPESENPVLLSIN